MTPTKFSAGPDAAPSLTPTTFLPLAVGVTGGSPSTQSWPSVSVWPPHLPIHTKP